MVVSFSWLLRLGSLNTAAQVSLWYSIESTVHHGAVQLGHMVGLFAALWGFSTLISSVAAQVFTPTKSE